MQVEKITGSHQKPWTNIDYSNADGDATRQRNGVAMTTVAARQPRRRRRDDDSHDGCAARGEFAAPLIRLRTSEQMSVQGCIEIK